jgi:hypothetical protein
MQNLKRKDWGRIEGLMEGWVRGTTWCAPVLSEMRYHPLDQVRTQVWIQVWIQVWSQIYRSRK